MSMLESVKALNVTFVPFKHFVQMFLRQHGKLLLICGRAGG